MQNIMLLDRAEMERRLGSPRNLLNQIPPCDRSIRMPLHTRACSPHVPQSLKIVAGVLAKTEKTSEVADALGVSTSVVARSKNGKDPKTVVAVERTTERIRDIALDKLMDSLGIIDETTLSSCGAKDASIVARNLAGVVEKLSPRDATASLGNTLIIYAPRQKEEKQFQTINVEAIESI